MIRLNGILGGFVFLAFIACAAPAPEPVPKQTEQVVQVRPSGPLFTNQGVELQVDVTGNSDLVEVLRDGQQVAVLHAPYTYAWDTRSVPEGTYGLTARITRGTQVTNSQPVQVTVDRTAPLVVSQVPGALGHVLNAQPLLVRFDEPVRVAASEDGLSLRQKRNAVPISGQVAVEGSTLKFMPTALEQGSWHEVRVGPGIRDLAGNAAVAVSWDVLAQQWEGRTYTLDEPGLVTKPVVVRGARRWPFGCKVVIGKASGPACTKTVPGDRSRRCSHHRPPGPWACLGRSWMPADASSWFGKHLTRKRHRHGGSSRCGTCRVRGGPRRWC
jgi:Bacterial Ig-like domain